jgi:hypothetical protein
MATDRATNDLWDTGFVLADALIKAFGELLTLAGLEARIALRSLVRAVVLSVVGLLLLVGSVLLTEAALIAGLLAAGLPTWGALATSAALNALALFAVGRYRQAVLQGIRFRATRRQITQLMTPTYGNAGGPP